MKFIIGLGNPGEEYANNRHNIGFMVADKLKEFKAKNLAVAKSDTFMNDSGVFVKRFCLKSKVDLRNLYIVHDDLDIPLGHYKIQFAKGPKDHNGLKSIDSELGTNEYWHIRVGVDSRTTENRIKGEEYVLQDFSDDESEKLDKVLDKVCNEITKLYP